MQIPIPSDAMSGMVDITATFCFAKPTDPQDPLNYARSGLEVRFRPRDQTRKDPGSITAPELLACLRRWYQLRDLAWIVKDGIGHAPSLKLIITG